VISLSAQIESLRASAVLWNHAPQVDRGGATQAPSVLITVSRVDHAVFGELLAFLSARGITMPLRDASAVRCGLDRSPLTDGIGGQFRPRRRCR